MRRIAGKVPITIGGNFDESSWDSYPGAARLPARAGVRRQHRRRSTSSRSSGRGSREAPKGIIPLTVVGGNGKPLGGTCMTSAGAGSGRASSSAVRLVPLRRREDGVPARGDPEARLPDRRRRAHGPVRDPPPARLHASVPTARSTPAPDSRARPRSRLVTSRAGTRRWRQAAAERFERLTAAQGRVRRLFVHPGLRRRLLGRRAHRSSVTCMRPSCHKGAMESALVSLAQRTAASVSV